MFHSDISVVRKRRIVSALIFALLWTLSGCVGGAQMPSPAPNANHVGGNAMKSRVELNVEIVAFRKQAIHDDFADGTSNSYDLTLLKVLDHGARFGTSLNVIHPAGVVHDPIWSSIGRQCKVKIDSWVIDEKEALIPASSLEVSCGHD